MIEKEPSYKLTYRLCLRGSNHTGEFLNYVCLNKQCSENSIICSICKQEDHHNHQIKPFKIFIEQLHQKYGNGHTNYESELKQIQKMKNQNLSCFKMFVDSIVEEIKSIEQAIIDYYQGLYTDVLEEKTKRQHFTQFYESLINLKKQQDTSFLIQNYLTTWNKQKNTHINFPDFQGLLTKVKALFKKTKDEIVTQKQIKMVSIPSEPKSIVWPSISNIETQEQFLSNLMMPSNIHLTNSILHQVDKSFDVPSMVILPISFNKVFNKKQLRLRITSVSKKSFIYIGLIEKDYAKTLNYKFPMHSHKQKPINKTEFNQKIYYLNNQGLAFGQKISKIQTFSCNSTIFLSLTNNKNLNLKLGKKTSIFQPKVKNGQQYFFFVALIGSIGVQLKFDLVLW